MTITVVYGTYIYTVTTTTEGELVEVLRQHDLHEIPYNVELDAVPTGLLAKLEHLHII